jgi:hypothetical protein
MGMSCIVIQFNLESAAKLLIRAQSHTNLDSNLAKSELQERREETVQYGVNRSGLMMGGQTKKILLKRGHQLMMEYHMSLTNFFPRKK